MPSSITVPDFLVVSTLEDTDILYVIRGGVDKKILGSTIKAAATASWASLTGKPANLLSIAGITMPAFGLALLTLSSAAAARTAIGLGTGDTVNFGALGATSIATGALDVTGDITAEDITADTYNGTSFSGGGAINTAGFNLTLSATAALGGTNTGDNAVNSLYSGLVSNATHTGDATGATALTLATVNSNVGTFGSATQVGSVTVNAKGLVTAASNVTITPAVGSITGLGTNVATALGNTLNAASGLVGFSGNVGAATGTNLTLSGGAKASDYQLTSTTNQAAMGSHGGAFGILFYAESAIGPKLTAADIRMPSTHSYAWTDGTSYAGTKDTGISRKTSTPGTIRVGNGTANDASGSVELTNLTASGDLICSAAGKGLQLKTGTGARGGNATLVAGTVTVTNSTVTANTLVVLDRKTAGGTLGNLTYTLSAGASFTVNSDSALDTSVITYHLIELNP